MKPTVTLLDETGHSTTETFELPSHLAKYGPAPVPMPESRLNSQFIVGKDGKITYVHSIEDSFTHEKNKKEKVTMEELFHEISQSAKNVKQPNMNVNLYGLELSVNAGDTAQQVQQNYAKATHAFKRK